MRINLKSGPSATPLSEELNQIKYIKFCCLWVKVWLTPERQHFHFAPLSTFLSFFHFRRQIFEDAYKSQLSCVVVDDIERLLGEPPNLPSTFSLTVFWQLRVWNKSNDAANKNKTCLTRLRSDRSPLLQPSVTSFAGAAEKTSSKGKDHWQLHLLGGGLEWALQGIMPSLSSLGVCPLCCCCFTRLPSSTGTWQKVGEKSISQTTDTPPLLYNEDEGLCPLESCLFPLKNWQKSCLIHKNRFPLQKCYPNFPQ